MPPTLRKYVDLLHAAYRPLCFTEIMAVSPRQNQFRRLWERGLIRNIVPDYSTIRGEPFTGGRMPLYVLSDEGLKYVDEVRYRDLREVCSCCHRANPVRLEMLDGLRQRALPPEYHHKPVCIVCFDVMATLRGVDWTDQVTLVPVSGVQGREPVEGD